MNIEKLESLLREYIADQTDDSDAPLPSADICRFLGFFLGPLSIALIINIAVLMYAPLEFLESRWEQLVAPLSIVVGIVAAVCIQAIYGRLRR